MGKTLKISKPLLLLIITIKKLIFDICDTHQHTKTRNTHKKVQHVLVGTSTWVVWKVEASHPATSTQKQENNTQKKFSTYWWGPALGSCGRQRPPTSHPPAHKNKKITHKKSSARTGGDKTTQNTKIQKLFSFIKVHFRI